MEREISNIHSMEREISNIHSCSSGAGEPSSSVASSSVAVAGDDINAQEDARNNKNYAAWTAEKKYGCHICKKGFKARHALYGHMRTHPKAWRGVEPPPAAAAAAERQGHDVRESSAEAEQRWRNVRESTCAAAEQSSPDPELAPTEQSAEDDEDVRWWNMEAVVDQLLFLIKESTDHRRQGNDGDNSQNNIPSHNSAAAGGEVIMKDGFNEPANINIVATGVVVVDAIIPACNETVSDEKKEKSSKKKSSRGSSSSAHTCEVCGETFAKGQSLGGHKRKHYDIQKIIDNKRAREKQKETPAPAVERRVQGPAELTGHAVAPMAKKIQEERTASSCNAPLESHNPALLLQSVQLEGPSAANGGRRPHDFDLNEPAEPEEEERENAPQPRPEPERKDDDDGDDALLSFRLWPKFDSQRSN